MYIATRAASIRLSNPDPTRTVFGRVSATAEESENLEAI